MPEICIDIKNKVATVLSENTYIVSGNSDYVLRFNFDDEWTDYSVKTLRINIGDEYVEKPFTGNTVTLDPITVDVYTECRVGVYAGNIHTTVAAVLMCVPSIIPANFVHQTPSEDVYNQLIELIGSLEMPTATTSTLGAIKVGSGLKIQNGTLSADTVNAAQLNSTKPITSGAVYSIIGDISTILAAL